MKLKKLVSVALAGVMTLALAAPALADTTTVITSNYEEPVIDVVVQPTGTALINPYGMPYKVYGDSDTTKATPYSLTTAGKIATRPLVMWSTCEVPLTVGATVTTKVSGVTLTSKTPSTTEKEAQVYLEIQQDNTLAAGDIKTTSTTFDTISGLNVANVMTAFNAWAVTSYSAAANQVLCSTDDPVTASNLCTLAAGTDSDSDGKVDAPSAGGFALYRLGGDATKAPESAWKSTDSVIVTVAFTFEPTTSSTTTPPASGITVTVTSDTTITGSESAAITMNLTATPSGDSGGTYKWSITSDANSYVTSGGSGTAATETVVLYRADRWSSGDTVTITCTYTASDGTTTATDSWTCTCNW